MLMNKQLVSIDDFSTEEVDDLLTLAHLIHKSPHSFSDCCSGKIMGALFFEPSTRTRLSFESAMYRLGGEVIGFSDAKVSSTAKGESLSDTIRTVSNYCDLLVMRHPQEGSAKLAANSTNRPLINAGDGGHQHPTQTLTDLLTIQMTKNRLSNLTIGLSGDLNFGRTVHSLIHAMVRYPNNRFILIAPEELQLPDYLRFFLEKNQVDYQEVSHLEEAMADLDVLYMTRVQRERFFNEADYIRLKDANILTKSHLKRAKPDLAILHPLPRVNEIAKEVDQDPRAKYFDQTYYGVIVRMALMIKMLGVESHA